MITAPLPEELDWNWFEDFACIDRCSWGSGSEKASPAKASKGRAYHHMMDHYGALVVASIPTSSKHPKSHPTNLLATQIIGWITSNHSSSFFLWCFWGPYPTSNPATGAMNRPQIRSLTKSHQLQKRKKTVRRPKLKGTLVISGNLTWQWKCTPFNR